MRFLTEQSIVLAIVLALPVDAAPLPGFLTLVGGANAVASTVASGATAAEAIHSLRVQKSQGAGPPPPMSGWPPLPAY